VTTGKERIMPQRMKNPAMLVPDAMEAIGKLNQAARSGAASDTLLELVHLRASQINGCSSCVDAGARQAKRAGERDERLFAVVWDEARRNYDEQALAALVLSIAITNLFNRLNVPTKQVPGARG